MRTLASTSLAFFLLALAACGGGSAPPPTTGTSLTGNWQLDLLQEEPRPQTPLSISGFLVDSSNALTGSVEVPAVAAHNNCGGIGSVTGSISGQNVTIAVDEAGTTLNFTGTLSPDGTSMSGDYQGPGGGCYTTPTTGTWNGFLIPSLSGNFTGTINSSYMQILQGAKTPVPVAVTGSITQSTNAGTGNATLTGTISASGYPCFSNASLSGTISGQNVYLNIFGYNGVQIGTLGQPGTVGAPNSPATVVVQSGKVSLIDTSNSGFFLGAAVGNGTVVGPCPPLIVPGSTSTQTSESASVQFDFQ